MKVVQINAVCGYGSTGRTCVELSEKLTEKGIENYIFYGNQNSDYPLGERINSDLDVKVHAFLSRLTGKQSYFSYGATKRLIKRLKQLKPDVVHLRNLHGNFINLKMLLKFIVKEDIATVITLHDFWFMTGKCTHFTTDKCYRWQIGCGNCPRLKNDNPSWFFDATEQMWKDKKRLLKSIPRLAVTGVSDWVTDIAKKSGFFQNAVEIKRIYNWIDFDKFFPQNSNIKKTYGIPENKFTILVVASVWNKGSIKLNDMFAIADLMGDDAHFIVVGDGIDKIKLLKNMTAAGYINDVDMLSKLYSAADLYVHVSREDTFGKCVAEALACGTPVIVYNSTALPELVDDGCGYVVECGELSEVCEKIRIVKEKKKENYTETCLSFAKENFEKDKLISDTVELYKSLIDMRK